MNVRYYYGCYLTLSNALSVKIFLSGVYMYIISCYQDWNALLYFSHHITNSRTQDSITMEFNFHNSPLSVVYIS